MKKQFVETIEFGEGVSCEAHGAKVSLTKGSANVSRTFTLPLHTALHSEGKSLKITCTQGNKNSSASVGALAAHIRNLERGLNEEFVYELEICNVHFPMTVKVEGQSLVVTNFLGEKQKRVAEILSGVTVKVEGTKVIVSSRNIESAGQTAANIERATNVTRRDRRVFQDGIFVISKNGRPI